MNRIASLLLATSFITAPALAAGPDEGLQLAVTVLNSDGEPIPTATIRHPEEQDRHRVNAVTGTWEESELYMLDGSEFPFARGTLINLEISAPGYVNQPVSYKMRRWRNKLVVQLDELVVADDDILEDSPMIQFARDRPID